jgi:hypothetical protein
MRKIAHDNAAKSLAFPELLSFFGRACCLLSKASWEYPSSSEMEQRLAAPTCRVREDWRCDAMTKDDRDLLELLKDELAFIEQGGYGRSVRTPWLPKSAFQDSLTCINYGYPYRAHPCTECQLLDFVAPEHQREAVPCHFICLNDAGETIEDLEEGDQYARIEVLLRKWLQTRIGELEMQKATTLWRSAD